MRAAPQGLRAKINETKEGDAMGAPLSGTVHHDLAEAHPTICRWVLGYAVSTEALERELRAAADEELAALKEFTRLQNGGRQ